MKNCYILFVLLLIAPGISAQRGKLPQELKSFSVKMPVSFINESTNGISVEPPYLNPSKIYLWEEVGTTVYDLQTNQTVDNRIYLYPDNTVGVTYTFGNQPPSYPDRGTGYQYFDGTQWLSPFPSARVEDVKTGWPSYSHLGTGGEVFVSHIFGTGLVMCKRPVKGAGSWTQANIPQPPGLSPYWPRICVNGNSIHILAASNVAYQGQTNPFVYYRSLDGGDTWDIMGTMFPQLSPASGYTWGFGADVYDWAEPQGNNLAFLVGSKVTDLVLMKSSDNGDTWTKTTIFQHPYPDWKDNVLTPDTPYVCDGAHAVALDAQGNAHVAFGLNRMLNDDTTDASYSYFPGVDGLAYWREGDPVFTSANPDDVWNLGKLVGYVLDLDSSGVVLDNYTTGSIASYQVGLTSQPQISIASNGNIYLIFRSLVETMMSSAPQFFSHIWGRVSIDGGNNWCDFVELTAGQDHEFAECVFPAMSKTINNKLHIMYQYDFEPGTSIGADGDPTGINSIMYATFEHNDIAVNCVVNVEHTNLSGELFIYPNPAGDYVNVVINNNKNSETSISVFDIIGNRLLDYNTVTGRCKTEKLDISNLKNGMYLVRIESGNETYFKKLMKGE